MRRPLHLAAAAFGAACLLVFATGAGPARAAAGAPADPGGTAAGGAAPGAGAGHGPLPTIAAQVAGMERRPGLLDLYLDRRHGKVWLRVPPPSGPGGEVASYLYAEGLVSGLGSNPVGLDRGQSNEARVVTLRRLGAKVLVEAENLRFRALGGGAAEQRAVRESFAPSVLGGDRKSVV